MADRSHLTPVPTTDKRGRATTVYRNLRAGRRAAFSASDRPATPPRPALAVPEPNDRLPEVHLRNGAELAAFDASVASSLRMQFESYTEGSDRWGQTTDAMRAASLAMDILDSGALDMDTVAFLLNRAKGWEFPGMGADLLRVAAHLWPQRGEVALGTDWGANVANAVCGLHESDFEGAALIESGAQLESYSAVVRFVLHTWNDERRLARVTFGSSQPTTAVINPGLAALLREHPRDFERILAFARERGMDPYAGSEAAEVLRGVLDSPSTAIDSGWL